MMAEPGNTDFNPDLPVYVAPLPDLDAVLNITLEFPGIFSRSSSPRQMAGTVAGRCAELLPHCDWTKIASLDWNGEPQFVADWIEQELPRVRGCDRFDWLVFALHNPVLRGIPTIDMGINIFRRENGKVVADAGTGPENDLASSLLNQLYHLAYRDERSLGNNAEYTFGLAYSGFIIPLAMQRVPPEVLFAAGAERIELAAGFHDGAYFRLGDVCRGAAGPVSFECKPVLACW